MPRYFFDTSALVKAYHEEAGSELVRRLLAETGNAFFISSLTLVEFESAFAQNLRAGTLSLPHYQVARRTFGGDLQARRIVVKNLLRSLQSAAEALIASYAPRMRFRTLDALQLAVALALASAKDIDHFLVADESLAKVAVLEGLSVINPASP